MSDNPAYIFDTESMLQNRARSKRLGNEFDFLRAEIADRMQDRLLEVNRKFYEPLDIGGDYGRFADWPSETPTTSISDKALGLSDESHDIIVSNLHMHWVNDLPGLLVQANKALKPDGLFLGSLLGGETLVELRHALLAAESEVIGGAHQRVIPFADVRDMGSLLQRAGFALPVADIDTITITYEHPLKLMQELRGMGEANALLGRPKNFMRRDVLMKACEIYARDFSNDDGRIRATFQIIYITGWHPHESQQKPLKRGSATMRLEDALKAGTPQKT